MSALSLPWTAEHARRRAERRLRDHVWPEALHSAIERLEHGGHRVLLVGGSVRDVLLGRPADRRWDLAADLPPAAVRERFERTEGIGERHGTVLVLWEGLEI